MNLVKFSVNQFNLLYIKDQILKTVNYLSIVNNIIGRVCFNDTNILYLSKFVGSFGLLDPTIIVKRQSKSHVPNPES